jgi:undecaprenyl-diphosphatase
MIELLNEIDTEVFFFLNGIHSAFFDVWMYRITDKTFWIPLYGFIIIIVAIKYKKEAFWIILGGIICIALSDMVVSGIMKPFFERLRPSRDPALVDLVHTVNNYYGGKYSFASGHAATSFSMATFFWLTTRNKLKWIGLLFLWAVLFSYSRIYLGVHYPGDIIVGATIGSIIAWLVSIGIQKIFILKIKLKKEVN